MNLAELVSQEREIIRQVAHDIRSPLTVLQMAIANLENTPPEVRRLISSATKRVADIANELLKNSKSSTAVHALAPLIEQMAVEKTFQFQERKDLVIEAVTAQEEVHAKVDSIEFLRVISNLLNNAAESIPYAGRISVSVFQTQLHAIVEVTDTGCGISPFVLDKLGLEEISAGKNGSGIGLMHAFQAVAKWNASIKIETSSNGTKVRITLPLAKPAATSV